MHETNHRPFGERLTGERPFRKKPHQEGSLDVSEAREPSKTDSNPPQTWKSQWKVWLKVKGLQETHLKSKDPRSSTNQSGTESSMEITAEALLEN